MDFIQSFNGVAIVDNNRSYSFDDLYNRIRYYDSFLSNFSNSRIALVSEFSFESVALFLAFARNQNFNTLIPITPSSEHEVDTKIKVSESNFVFRFNSTDNELKVEKGVLHPNSQTSGIILFSSGTTGVPKMMFHEFSNLISLFDAPIKRQRNIRILLFLMFDHIGGINTFLNCVKDGSTIVIPQSRSVDHVVELIKSHNVNVLPTTPTFLNLLLIDINNIKSALRSLKLITYGTERMPKQILDKLRLHLPHVKLLQTFGTSETGILKTVSKSSDSLYFKISDDRYEYKVERDILFIRSRLSIKGYLNTESSKFDSNGWYETGDIVKYDSDGYMTIVGRINEVINVGGLKVMPKEIEDILLTLDFVKDCLVYGERNLVTGQMVSAKIVLNFDLESDIQEAGTKKRIKDYCKSNLDKYKVPVRLDFVDELSFSNRFKKLLS